MQYNLKKQHCCSYYSCTWYDEGNLKKTNLTEHFELHYPQEKLICHKKIIPTIYYISNWSKVVKFYLTPFFNLKSWTVKFQNLELPVHYAALFINTTINTNYITLLMALHHTHDEFWYLLKMLQEQHSFLTHFQIWICQ